MKSLLHFAATKESLERICNRNGNAYVFPHRRLKHRIAERLIRLYNRALGDALWSGATSHHPAWLQSVWRWCGVWGVLPRFLHVGAYISSCYTKKLVKDEKGVWWCETTFTPREWPDLRKIVADNMLRDLAVPEVYMNPKPAAFHPADIVLGIYAGKRDLFRMWSESEGNREERRAALRKATMLPITDLLVDLLENHRPPPRDAHIISGGMACSAGLVPTIDKVLWGTDPGKPDGDCTGRIVIHKARGGPSKRVFFRRPLGVPFVVTPTEHLPPGIAGLLMYKGSPEMTRIIVETPNPQTTMPLATTSILVLRRSDLLPEHRDSTIWAVRLPQFANPPADFEAASHIVFIDGTRQRLLKSRDSSDVSYNKASYFNPRRAEQKVVDGRLITAFPDDVDLGIKAGTLFCEPWTEEDGANADGEDDVMGVTVSREGQTFHDVGIYIPNPPGNGC